MEIHIIEVRKKGLALLRITLQQKGVQESRGIGIKYEY